MNAPGWLSFSKYLEVSAPLVALVVASPILVIVASVFAGESAQVWSHLRETVLADYVTNSVLLMLGVGVVTLVLGVPAAWYTAVCEFPGRSVFVWALLLPLAFPAYIIAYTYTGLLEFAGPVQTLLRELTGWRYGDYWFFPSARRRHRDAGSRPVPVRLPPHPDGLSGASTRAVEVSGPSATASPGASFGSRSPSPALRLSPGFLSR